MNEPARIEKEEWEWVQDRVRAHEAELKTFRRDFVNIRLALEDLSKWKDDSKVIEIASLKGRLRRNDKIRDRIMYALLLGGAVEVVRLVVDHFATKFH
jgi:Holliday junction resolvase RusA-like endonuclease